MPAFIQAQNEIRQDQKIRRELTFFEEIIRKRQTQGILALFVFALIVPSVVYFLLIGKAPVKPSNSCAVKEGYRITCGRLESVNFDYCESISCCFDNSTKTCYHYLPSKYHYGKNEKNVFARSLSKTPFGKNMQANVDLSINELNENTLQIILHDTEVFTQTVDNKNYNYKVNESYGSVTVKRNDTILLTTAKGPTIVSDKYWEWSFHLTEEYLFGLGQTLIQLEEGSNLTKVIYGNDNDHNTLPMFLAYQKKNFHGLVVRHSGPLEVTVLSSNLVSLKSLAGQKIVLELSVGPSLKEVLEQQKQQRPSVNNVDLNTLGIHFCREGSFTTLREILNEYNTEQETIDSDYVVQYDSHCFHQNLMMALRRETSDEIINNAKAAIQNLTVAGSQFTLSFPPQVLASSELYKATKDLGIYFKLKKVDYVGLYLSQKVVYPNFEHANIDHFVEKVKEELNQYFSENLPSSFILNNNWPSDESFTMDKSTDFQYLSQTFIDSMSKTLPWNATSNSTLHYLNHNNYGFNQVQQFAVFNKSVATASHTFDLINPITVQNVEISWTNFRKAIITTLYNGIFGFPLTSIPVCGSTQKFDSSSESLCLRWYLMASTAPLFHISSDSPRRDPGFLTSKYIAKKALEAIEFRKSLQYYFYTVLSSGEPLMRPMFYDFSSETETFQLDSQYMVGEQLLVAHPTLPDQSIIKIYLPKSVSTWYEYGGGKAYSYSKNNNGTISLPIVESDWIGFIRHGTILALIKTSAENSTKKVTMKIALNCDESCTAAGTTKFDDNNFMEFKSYGFGLNVSNKNGTLSSDFVLSEIIVYKPDKKTVFTTDTEIKLADVKDCHLDSTSKLFTC